jgi:REP element-mobilizing transposase RayT
LRGSERRGHGLWVPRSLRAIEPGGIYHVTSHGLDDRLIFRDDVDRAKFLDLLAPLPRRLGWEIFIVCPMGTHFHLLLQVDDPNLSLGMERLNGDYARGFNRRHGRRGHLFEKRFDAKPVAGTGHLLHTVRYIALNPVGAGLADVAEDWLWCSYGATIGVRPQWPWIADETMLRQFGPTRGYAVTRLRAYVDERAAHVATAA